MASFLSPQMMNSVEMAKEIYKSIEEIRSAANKREEEIKGKLEKLNEEKEKWNKMEEVMDARYGSKKSKVILDVGGERFATSKSTLYQQSVSDYFWYMIRSEWTEGDDGTYFIERNPKNFLLILRYMRDGDFVLEKMSEDEKEVLKSDLNFFRVLVPKEFRRQLDLETPLVQNKKGNNCSKKEGLDLVLATMMSNEIDNQIKKDLIRIQMQIEIHKELEKFMKDQSEKSSSKVILDVGGKRFSSSKQVLTSQPDSYFSALIRSGNWQPDEDGSYFIDRDSRRFSIILEYLRTGRFDIGNENKESLKRDLDFFQIQVPEGLWISKAIRSKPPPALLQNPSTHSPIQIDVSKPVPPAQFFSVYLAQNKM